MFYVYIIYSQSIDAFYVGQTIDISIRIEEHNTKSYDNSSTAKAKDWELYFSIECYSRNQSIFIERHIKSMKSRKYYESLKTYPEISEKLLNKYSK